MKVLRAARSLRGRSEFTLAVTGTGGPANRNKANVIDVKRRRLVADLRGFRGQSCAFAKTGSSARW
eukprot:3095135-Pyramimonas_sp.AAC.1